MLFFFAVAAALFAGVVADLVPRHVVPRFKPLTLPIHPVASSSLHTRDVVGTNGQQGNGLSAVGMSSDRQSHYTVLKVGEINFRVALDTASSDLWIVSTGCATAPCTRVPRYPLAYQSPTFLAVDGNATAFSAGYADGSTASGFVAKETIQVANLTIAEQPFGLVTESNVTLNDEVSGIFGLGFPRISSISSATNSTPFFTTLAYKGLLDYPLFALSLTKNGTGSLTLGAIDSSVVNNTNHISWNRVAAFPPFVNEVNVTSPSYLQWAIPITSFYVNDVRYSPISTYPNIQGGRSLALIDVGAAGISGPIQDVSRIFGQIEGARLVNSDTGQWVIPCDTTVPMTFTFGNANYTLLPEDYLIGPASGNPNLCLSWPRASPPNSDGIDWQFGAPFLRTVYSVYSFGINSKEPPIIGFYPLRNATELANLTASQTPEYISSYLASISASYPTTLPNVILPTPTYTVPPYALNSSITAPVGAVMTSGLATSTYTPLFGTHTPVSITNTSAVPTVKPEPTVSTFTVTDDAGQITVGTAIIQQTSVPLGIPPGWSGAVGLKDRGMTVVPVLIACFLSFVSWTVL